MPALNWSEGIELTELTKSSGCAPNSSPERLIPVTAESTSPGLTSSPLSVRASFMSPPLSPESIPRISPILSAADWKLS